MAQSRLPWGRLIGVFLVLGVFGGAFFLQTASVTRALDDPTPTVTPTTTPTLTPTMTATPTPTPTATVTPTPFVTATSTLAATRPIATVNPTTISFGSVQQGTSSATQTVTLTNTGGANLTFFTAPELKGGDVLDFTIGPNSCGTAAPLTPGTSCTAVVRFNPPGDAIGNRSTTLLFRDDSATGSPQFVLLNGTATAAPTPTSGSSSVSFSPTTVSFSSQPLATTSGAQFVVVTNIGSSSLTITDVTKSGGNAGDFSDPSTNCITTLPAGAQCQLSITFTPTQPGNRATTVIITDNAPTSGSTQVIVVSGIGTGVVPTPTATFAPTPAIPPTPPPTPTRAVTPTTAPPPPPTVTATAPAATPGGPTATATTGNLPGLPNTGAGSGQDGSGASPGSLALLVSALLVLVVLGAILRMRRWVFARRHQQ